MLILCPYLIFIQFVLVFTHEKLSLISNFTLKECLFLSGFFPHFISFVFCNHEIMKRSSKISVFFVVVVVVWQEIKRHGIIEETKENHKPIGKRWTNALEICHCVAIFNDKFPWSIFSCFQTFLQFFSGLFWVPSSFYCDKIFVGFVCLRDLIDLFVCLSMRTEIRIRHLNSINQSM